MSSPVQLPKPEVGGRLGRGMCSAPHPERDDVWCRRLPHAEGKHRAFVHSIRIPEEW